MFLSPRLSTSYGLALCSHPTAIVIPSRPDDALAFAIRVDREADQFLAEGNFVQAERLSHLALEARCRAIGGRA